MKQFFLLATLAIAAKCQIFYDSEAIPKQADQLKFLSFTAKFGKSYTDTDEFNERIRYYMAVDNFINNYDELDVQLGHNKFSDWSPEEKQKLLGRRTSSRSNDEIDVQDQKQSDRHLATRELQSTNTTCKNDGFFLIPCNYGCRTCKNATTCLECWTKNFNLTRGVCSCATKQVNDNITECFYCPKSTFWNTTKKSCDQCSQGCGTCTSLKVCTTCNSNWTKLSNNTCNCQSGNINNKTQECLNCLSTQFFDGSKCQNCPANCNSCTKFNGVCTACKAPFTVQSNNTCGCSPGTSYNKNTNKCESSIVCPSDTFLNTTLNTCVDCSFGCASCTNSTTCNTCRPNWTMYKYINFCYCASGNTNYYTDECVNCTSTQFFDGEKCLSCPANCTSCSRYYGVCNACTAPFTVQNTTNTCGCSAGTLYDKTTNSCVKENICASDNFLQLNNTCAPCGNNCTSCQKYTGKCLNCSSNNIINWQNDKECIFSSCYKIGPVGNQTVCLEKAYNQTQIVAPFAANATSFDWRTIPIIWGIQDQGYCGSCYAFSAIVSYESAWAIKTGNLYKLSEQHIVDCDSRNYGCDGGWQDYAVAFLAKNGTIQSSDYAYTSGKSGLKGTCKESGKPRPFKSAEPSNYYVKSNKESFIAALRQQPLIVSFAVGDEFYYVSTGIYTGTKCSTYMNHAMTAVAYGVENGVEYVVIQNQWGTSWGDKGYVKVALTSTTSGVCQLYSDNYVVLV